MASQNEEKKRKRETRTPTMTRRKLSMKSFISGISVDDTLSSFLHGFKVFSFSLSLSHSFPAQLAIPPWPRAHFAVISLGCRETLLVTYLSYGAPLGNFRVTPASSSDHRTDEKPTATYTLILNNDTLVTWITDSAPSTSDEGTSIRYTRDVFSQDGRCRHALEIRKVLKWTSR